MKYNDLEGLVYRMQLTYDEVINILRRKYNPTKRTCYSLNPSIYEVVNSNNTIKFISPNIVKFSITIDDVRLKSNLKFNQSLIFTNKSYFKQF